MQIRQLRITNFRGVASLDWKPGYAFCCLIGAGDSGKSTVLDAVEAVLSSRWFSFSESDFLEANRSEEHTSELQPLMRISYAVFCLKKKIRIAHRLTPTKATQ